MVGGVGSAGPPAARPSAGAGLVDARPAARPACALGVAAAALGGAAAGGRGVPGHLHRRQPGAGLGPRPGGAGPGALARAPGPAGVVAAVAVAGGVIEKDNEIIPIEVKLSETKVSSALKSFINDYNPKRAYIAVLRGEIISYNISGCTVKMLHIGEILNELTGTILPPQ